MHRRFHKRRWTLTCFLAAMVILPTAAVLQKDNDAQNKSAAHAYAEKEGAAQSVSWNVFSDGYGWEEETAPVAAEISAELPEQKASADAGEKPYPESWNLSSDTSVQRTSYGTYSGTRFFSLFSAGQNQHSQQYADCREYGSTGIHDRNQRRTAGVDYAYAHDRIF